MFYTLIHWTTPSYVCSYFCSFCGQFCRYFFLPLPLFLFIYTSLSSCWHFHLFVTYWVLHRLHVLATKDYLSLILAIQKTGCLFRTVAVSCWLIHIMFSFVLFAFPEVYQRGPLGSTQTQTWDDAEIRTSQDWFGHYCRYSRPCETDVHLHCVFKCPHAAFRWTIFTLTSACSNTRYHMGFYIQCKCELTVVLLLWIVISAHYIFLDQTPTPTRFLKNCEEVGLFNELASSFEQDDDEKRAKNSVSNTCGWWFYLLLSLRLCMTVCITVYSNRRNFLQRLDMTRKNYILLPSFFISSINSVKKFTNLNFVPCTQSVCHLLFSFCSNFFLNCLVFYCILYAFQSWGCGCLVCDECPLPFFFFF